MGGKVRCVGARIGHERACVVRTGTWGKVECVGAMVGHERGMSMCGRTGYVGERLAAWANGWTGNSQV